MYHNLITHGCSLMCNNSLLLLSDTQNLIQLKVQIVNWLQEMYEMKIQMM